MQNLFSRVYKKIFISPAKTAVNNLQSSFRDQVLQLAQAQAFAHAAESFEVFGHATIRNILSASEVDAISSALDDLGAGISCDKTVVTAIPLEKSRDIQQVVFQDSLLRSLQSIVADFWYFSSDAYVGGPVFARHRDTFVSPPFFKFFIPLVPCTFAVLPGSHWYGDQYARRAGKYATNWDNGKTLMAPTSEVYFNPEDKKLILDAVTIPAENLLQYRKLNPGDIFIFSQNAVHGLTSELEKNFFLSITVVPSPSECTAYGLTRTEHLEQIIDNIASASVVDVQLSGGRKMDPDECFFYGYKFSKEDFKAIASADGWHDCFGLRFIEKEKWQTSFQLHRHKGIQHIQDRL